jgi:histidyl-tRNA synthetase
MAERLRVASVLREAGLRVRPDGSARKLGRQLESAAKVGARWAVIVGEAGQLTVRDLEAGTQREATWDEAAQLLSAGG